MRRASFLIRREEQVCWNRLSITMGHEFSSTGNPAKSFPLCEDGAPAVRDRAEPDHANALLQARIQSRLS